MSWAALGPSVPTSLNRTQPCSTRLPGTTCRLQHLGLAARSPPTRPARRTSKGTPRDQPSSEPRATSAPAGCRRQAPPLPNQRRRSLRFCVCAGSSPPSKISSTPGTTAQRPATSALPERHTYRLKVASSYARITSPLMRPRSLTFMAFSRAQVRTASGLAAPCLAPPVRSTARARGRLAA